MKLVLLNMYIYVYIYIIPLTENYIYHKDKEMNDRWNVSSMMIDYNLIVLSVISLD